MLDYKIKLINECNIDIFYKIYQLYCIYNEDRTQKDFLNELLIEKFYTNIIIIYNEKEIVGYSLIKIIEEQKYIIYILAECVLLEKYVGNSVIMLSNSTLMKKIYRNDKIFYLFGLCNTIYSYLMSNNFGEHYPNMNYNSIPKNYEEAYKQSIKLFTDNIYNNEGDLNLILKYKDNFGRVKKKYAEIRKNFKKTKKIDYFLNLNSDYLNGDCLFIIGIVDIKDIDYIIKKNKKNNRLSIIINHFGSFFG